ncbi:MAG: hypothetical protein FWG98_15200 [Candidatus Cloacimonetes bacterium]|nr:hypothetical protein [Candidatus Cloacimonadota bacterium]
MGSLVEMAKKILPDDVVWRSAIMAKQKRKDVYCSVVVGYEGEDKWLEKDELKLYIENTKRTVEKSKWADYGINAIDAAISIFGFENVRAYTKGIPNVWCMDANEVDSERINDLLYPKKVFREGVVICEDTPFYQAIHLYEMTNVVAISDCHTKPNGVWHYDIVPNFLYTDARVVSWGWLKPDTRRVADTIVIRPFAMLRVTYQLTVDS